MFMAVCPGCGKDNPEGFKFCGFCTAPLDAVPETTAEERKVVSVLFVDLVGFGKKLIPLAEIEDHREALRFGPHGVTGHASARREVEGVPFCFEAFLGPSKQATPNPRGLCRSRSLA